MKTNTKLTRAKNFRASDSLASGIAKMSKKFGVTESEFIRRILTFLLQKDNSQYFADEFRAK